MTKTEFCKAKSALGYSIVKLSKELDMSPAQLYRYEKGTQEIPVVVGLAMLALFHRCKERLY